MSRLQLAVVLGVLVLCSSNADARHRRMASSSYYTPYYTNTVAQTQYYNPVVQAPVAAAPTVVSPTNNVVTQGVVQASGVATTTGVVQANATVSSPTAPGVAAAGSAQWKAEQSARMCSVQHIGGGFGGGSFEGNGFGATANQAIRNSCFWGQRTPIEIGVARGANGYYATIFYR